MVYEWNCALIKCQKDILVNKAKYLEVKSNEKEDD